MERRELFKFFIAGAAAAREIKAQHQHPGLSTPIDFAAYQPRFYNPREYAALLRLCDILIPHDHQSPAASEAGVGFYLDTLLLYQTPDAQQVWRNGLKLVDEAAHSRFTKPLVDCSSKEQELLMESMARNETNPQTDLEKFFVTLKNGAVEAYVLSDAGMREYLGYKGDAMLAEFPGCRDHPL